MGPPTPRARARELGLGFGELPTGPHNAITDVPGVLVGHVTCWSDDPVARTGVTAILPAPVTDVFHHPPAAGVAVLNGVGELTGAISIGELGFLDTPIMLTGTPSVGRIFDAVVDAMFEAVPAVGDDDVVAPVVGECNDAWLDDSRNRNVSVSDGRTAIDAATGGPVPEGVVGAGTGMIAMEHKADIGTASRVLEAGGTLGVLVLANFGAFRQLRVAGVPHGSGDIFLAVSTSLRVPRFASGRVSVEMLVDDDIGELFTATVDATEEAVTNALFVADTVVGRNGNTAPGLPVDRILELL